MKTRLRALQPIIALVLPLLLLLGCSEQAAPGAASAASATTQAPPTTASLPVRPEVILATTTSTQDSGLLDVLLPDFKARTGYNVKAVAVGSGQALKMGEEGNADVLLVHSPAAEQEFMKTGAGEARVLVMHNDFVIVGPDGDPAAIARQKALAAMQKIAAAGAPFVSRGDDSGTNALELKLWKQVGVEPQGSLWYVESGQGMGATLNIADEKNAYTISDRATYLAFSPRLHLKILVEGDAALLNIYHVIPISPDKWPQVNADGGRAFAAYLVSAPAQALINSFGVDKYQQPLFFADAGQTEADLGQ